MRLIEILVFSASAVIGSWNNENESVKVDEDPNAGISGGNKIAIHKLHHNLSSIQRQQQQVKNTNTGNQDPVLSDGAQNGGTLDPLDPAWKAQVKRDINSHPLSILRNPNGNNFVENGDQEMDFDSPRHPYGENDTMYRRQWVSAVESKEDETPNILDPRKSWSDQVSDQVKNNINSPQRVSILRNSNGNNFVDNKSQEMYVEADPYDDKINPVHDEVDKSSSLYI